ncbi:hypothetical protein EON65_36195 [archaeon]|nr:MAG: hypothetical protein EON65_36195 [archaeon]
MKVWSGHGAWCLEHGSGRLARISLRASSITLSSCISKTCGYSGNSRAVAQKEVANSEDVDMRDILQRDLKEVAKKAEELRKELDSQRRTERGFQILIQFVQDLLGRHSPAAHIYAMVIEEEYGKKEKVSWWNKMIIVLILIGLNGFFFYFTLLRGISKGPAWQRSYVTVWALQVAMDACFFETIHCVWFQYFIPRLARKEVQEAKTVLRKAAEEVLRQEQKRKDACCVQKGEMDTLESKPHPVGMQDVQEHVGTAQRHGEGDHARGNSTARGIKNVIHSCLKAPDFFLCPIS